VNELYPHCRICWTRVVDGGIFPLAGEYIVPKESQSSKRHAVRKTLPRRYLSFFSGALGLDLGLEKAGYQCLALNEIDPVACGTIQSNLKRAFPLCEPRVYTGDIRDLTAEKLCSDLNISVGDVFAIVGGPPCQAFSTAGRRLGLNDERGNVFLHYIDLIGRLRPKYAIFENVRGLLSSPLSHRPHNMRGPDFSPLTTDELPKGALRRVLENLSEYGYKTSFNLYNTANFGVPQIRERLIFIASREGDSVPYLVPTHDEHGRNGLRKWRSLEEAIGQLKLDNFEASRFPEKRLKYYRLLKAGQNWRDLPLELQPEAMGKSWYSGGGKTGFYRRLAWNRPSPTLVTSPTMPATDLCHPSELRPLSVQEYSAIQTFPTWYKFSGRLADKYRQIGNAVPPVLAHHIALHLAAFDEQRLAPAENSQSSLSRYVGTDDVSWLQDEQATLELQFA
jgi:DNA (cytosine-5)-methyltransferase 1